MSDDKLSLRSGVILGAIILTASLAGPALALRPAEGAEVAVVFAPWTDTDDAAERVWRAGGSIVAQESYRVLARSDDPNFLKRLSEAGALLTLDGEALRGLCGG